MTAPRRSLSVPPTLVRRARQRELAGDGRAGAWARGKARRAQYDYLRSHWRVLTGAALAMTAPIVAAALLVPGTFARGFLLGAGLASAAGALACWTLQVTGTAPAMMGDLAEQWTASELRALRRDGWRAVNHVRLRIRDIDHVLVGPAGCYSLETKWSSQPWQLDPPEPRVRQAAQQAHDNARDLRLWADFKAAGVIDVHPVVMLWGAGIAAAGGTDQVLVDGVPVVRGPSAGCRRAALLLGAPSLTPEQVERAWAALDRQARRRDDRDPESLPPSLGQLAARALLIAAAAAGGFLAASRLLPVTGSLYLWAAGCLLLVAAAVPLRRRERTRLPALAWQTGLVGALLMAVAAGLVEVLH